MIEFLAVDSASSGVAHLAHLGGALFGFLYIMFDKNSYVGLKIYLENLITINLK